MRIHFIRHAEALERSPDVNDDYRPLTCRGRTRFRRVAASLRKLDVSPDLIITSPLVRAVQTAEILAETLRFSGDLLVSPLLAASFSPPVLRDLLTAHAGRDELALVGHEPSLGLVVASLLGLDGPCAMKKGAVVTIQVCGQTNRFVALVTGGGRVITSCDKAVARLQGTTGTTRKESDR
jgi:phosphohistidine phosphatase